ncbi:FxsA family protein [Streptacidiphilus cavernicola]|uniref:FxsA family protein n=1 Tax=Streptacidiphilus cavernicola TaxID=3342716 RepID=A0ABV6VR89_9ACTN
MSQVRADTRPPRRLRRFLPLVVAAWAVLEIWLLIQLAGVIGGLGVLGVLLGAALLGGWVIKRAGMRALRATTAGMRGGPFGAAPGTGPVVDPGGDPIARESRTAVTIVGGLLLIVPGLLSDLLGLACLFPPTARLLRRFPERWVRRSTERLRIHRPDGKVVPGEVIVGEVVDPDPFAKKARRNPNDPYGYGDRDQLH